MFKWFSTIFLLSACDFVSVGHVKSVGYFVVVSKHKLLSFPKTVQLCLIKLSPDKYNTVTFRDPKIRTKANAKIQCTHDHCPGAMRNKKSRLSNKSESFLIILTNTDFTGCCPLEPKGL